MENSIFNITENTTLGELLEILDLGEKPEETPTVKKLRETAGEPIVTEERCKVYRNGWAVYDNGSGRAVVWLPECVSFTYQFAKPKTDEAWAVPYQEELPEGLLVSQPWPVAVTLLGDYAVERNLMKRKHSTLRAANDDEEPEDYEKPEDHSDDPAMFRFFHLETYPGENPETSYLRKELTHEMLELLTKKQRSVIVLYYAYGFTQPEIAKRLGITKQAVGIRLISALHRLKKNKKIYY